MPREGWWAYSKPIKAAIDWGLWLAAFPVAFYLRLDQPATVWFEPGIAMAALAAPLTIGIVVIFGLYRQSWAHTGLRDAERLASGVAVGSAVLFFLVWFANLTEATGIPRSVPLIAGLLALTLMGATRLAVRSIVEGRGRGDRGVVVVGTDQTAILFARNLHERDPDARLLGFIDDNAARQGVSYLGHRVLGTTRDVDRILEEMPVEEIVISGTPGRRSAAAVEAACHARGVRCRYLADPAELLYGRIQHAGSAGEGLQDLLQREVAALDDAAIRETVHQKRILVTGAGGSIGSELAKQVAAMGPSALLVLSHDENSIFDLTAALERRHPGLAVVPLVADLKHRPRLQALFQQHRPEVVFHAAAHKHVPLMEAHPCEAVINNVQGTRNLLSLSVEHGVERFVNLSTDKAVRPTNIMGATKHVAELLVREFASMGKGDYVSVRFGNVLGSRGSVVPTWTRQIEEGGPVTLTDERMTRYFMLIPEAVQLVLQAAELGGRGTTYVLDMGEPVRMRELAEQLIRLHGHVPDKDIQIVVTGRRPGEKLYEELLLDGRRMHDSPHPKILVEGDENIPDDLLERLDRLVEAAEDDDETAVRQRLEELVTGSDLVEDRLKRRNR